MRWLTGLLAAGAAFFLTVSQLVAAPLPAVTAPRVPDNFEQLSSPLPAPFDPNVDAEAQLADAQARARRADKLLLLELGANWCGYCRNLAGTMALPAMRRFVQQHFVELAIDVGRFDRNLAIASRFDVNPLPGIPVILIVDPASGKVLNEGRVSLFAHLQKPGPQAIANWLAQWVRAEPAR